MMFTTTHPLAGKPAPRDLIIDVQLLESQYFGRKPNTENPNELVSFGTSGHRGTPADGTFTEAHVLAIAQAVCDYRSANGIRGPIFVGKDTHALSTVAQQTAVEVLGANGVDVCLQDRNGFTPTPVISRTILRFNRRNGSSLGDGLVLTPSHNPPADGGIKYNPPQGGPADKATTNWIEERANELLHSGNKEVKRIPFSGALRLDTTHTQDFVQPYVDDLAGVIDMEAIRSAGLSIGVDPLGGSSFEYWGPISDRYRFDIEIVNPRIDPTFSFMPVDHDGKIRMDCSSEYAMSGLLTLKDRFDVAWANDPDADRHGIVVRSMGLLNPNHYLATAIWFLLQHREQWSPTLRVGKTLVTSSLIDRICIHLHRELWEVPVGFKWFAPELYSSSCSFGAEESAGASFLQKDGQPWTTDKDGLILGLLAAEIAAVTGKDPGTLYRDISGEFGRSYYVRIDVPATPDEKAALKKLSPQDLRVSELAGDEIVKALTRAPGNDAQIDGIKVITKSGWFAARPSGTENVNKIYAESFKSEAHLDQILTEARDVLAASLRQIV